ncbi:uncharacterized protein LOC129766997 [Toxorhynchites rutilus septentrionalis]|uniref:uncharacterized protein LOC129766997 n=1 Tax=Toxorhynchites rutilus septentrionalis TaxID=329112 RepID=UPI002478DDFD|nr:uncharacterized protein LOC129766997 [Toxorhynchites rutilus septentrionalis]
MMAYLASFLTDRTFKVAVGDRFSSEKIAENGVPQGAILSVTLFLLAMNSIFDFIPDGVKVILYADDILLISSGLVQRSRNRLQSAVKSVSMWADEVGFTISSEKSSILSIRRRARGAQRAPIFMNGKAIPEGFNSTLLGVTIDRNLNFKLNAKLVKKKIADHLNVLKAIKGRLKGSPRDSLLNIFKSWIIPRLVYGIILASKADKYFKMLESAYNSGIRIITGAFYSSPIKSLLAEIGEPPFEMVCVQRMIHALVRWEECPANLSLDTPYGVRARQKYQTLTGEILPRPLRLSRCSPRAWDAVSPSISWRVKRFVRAGDNPQKVQAVVNEALRTDFANKRIVYTDGSVTDDASAIGILDCNAKTSMRVPNEFSIFSCEALAIKLALESVTNADSVVVCSDSASVFKAVEGGTIKHPIIQEIEEQLRGSSAILCWIPGHTGIPGNEEADRLANEGWRGSITSMGIPGKDLIRRANNSILLTWEAEWNRGRDLQFRRIKASTGKWRDRANTYEQRILSRLRIGYTWLTHNFLAKKEEPLTCCGTRLTVGHILTECMRTADLRRRCFPGKPSLATLALILPPTVQAVCYYTIAEAREATYIPPFGDSFIRTRPLYPTEKPPDEDKPEEGHYPEHTWLRQTQRLKVRYSFSPSQRPATYEHQEPY